MFKMVPLQVRLKERFEAAALFYFEMADHEGRDFTEAEGRLVQLINRLAASVDEIPPATVRAAEAIRAEDHDRYWATFDKVLKSVGHGFEPSSAREFIGWLNRDIRLKVLRALRP